MQHRLVILIFLAFAALSPGRARAQDPGAPPDPGASEPTEAVEGVANAAAAAQEAQPDQPVEPDAQPPSAAAAADEPAAEFPSDDDATQQMMRAFAMTDAERAEYSAALRQLVGEIRGKVLAKLTAGIQQKQESKLDKFSLALSLFACAGVFLLLLPFKLRKKYPGKLATLFKYSGLAALLFFLAVNLFAAVLFGMRGAQGALGEYTNPQVQIINSTFDLFHDKADDVAVIGPILIEPTLASLSGHSDEPVISQLLTNAQRFKNDFTVFTSIARFFKKVDWLFGMLPIILIGLAVFLFARVARPTLTEIVRLPERAASGMQGVAARTVKLTLRNVWAEARSAFAAVGVLLVLTVIASVLLGFVLQPALEILIAYLTLSLLYVQLSPDASSVWVLFSLIASIVFLVLNLAVVVAASAFYLGKAQQIFQRRFRDGVPLSAHKRFWLWGSISALWVQVLPVLYIVVAVKGIGWLVEKSMEKFFNAEHPADSSWALLLASGPAMFLLTFFVAFFAARGFGALKFLAKYRVADAPMTSPPLGGLADHAPGVVDDASRER